MTEPVLTVADLRIRMGGQDGPRTVVDGVGFEVFPGEVLALVGESGCGKTKTAEAIMGLLPGLPRCEVSGRIKLGETELLALPESALRRVRGRDLSMVFQEPLTALDPVFTAGNQLATLYRRHRGERARVARRSALEMLRRVGFSNAAQIADSYPHQLSGGMRQRVVLAMAMACRPSLLIADEPTTALDVTTQARVLYQMTDLCRESGTAVLLITHDLGVVAHFAERALVMKDGRIVEDAPVRRLFTVPQHTHTQTLLADAQGSASR